MKEGNGEAVSFFHFSLIRTVGYAEGTLVRQKSKNFRFFFVLCSLIRTFALAIGSPPHHDWVVWRRS